MFGIGLPEMLLILALALIVVGPDKLPDLARSLAKGLLELKKTAEGLKSSLSEEVGQISEIKPDLESAAQSFKAHVLDLQEQTQANIRAQQNIAPENEPASQPQAEISESTADAVVTSTSSAADPALISSIDPAPHHSPSDQPVKQG